MSLNFEIARRYLFGKKTTNAINVITGISILGMTIGTAALLLILSVFNGFEELISKMFNSYNPDLKVKTSKGVYLDIDSIQMEKIYKIPGIKSIAQTLEEVVLYEYEGSQEAGFLKGVDDAFNKVNDIDSTIKKGEYITKQNDLNLAVMGSGMFNKLSVNPSDPVTPIIAYTALKDKGPISKDFNTINLYPSGIFSIGSEEDTEYILTNIEAVRSLIGKPNALNALEIRLISSGDEEKVKSSLENILGKENITIKNRYQQDEAFLKIMNIEKWISYLIACLTLALISFNLVGALWMIVLDKKRDISVLKSMGMTNLDVKKIITNVGVLIGIIGLVLGLFFAVLLYYLQKEYSLIAVPPGFLIDAYPISLKLTDVALVSITVFVLAYVASLLPAVRASGISAFVRHE